MICLILFFVLIDHGELHVSQVRNDVDVDDDDDVDVDVDVDGSDKCQ